jgi:hypothetical protein
MYQQHSDLGLLCPPQPFPTVDAHLGWLREQYRAQTPVRTRLCRLASLVAAGRPVQFHGSPVAVTAVQQAVRGYACQKLGYRPLVSGCSSAEVLAALSEHGQVSVTQVVGGLPARAYGLQPDGEHVQVTCADGVTRRLTQERFEVLFREAIWVVVHGPSSSAIAA